jgi:phage baseplate assembly protein W
MARHDYAYPFHLNAASGQAAQASYEDHVEQMIRQVLLTDPGERIDMPEFGCGLRRLIFAPMSDALQATTKMLVLQSLNRWLSDQIQVQNVTVSKPGEEPDGQLLIEIDYVLIETRSSRSVLVMVF